MEVKLSYANDGASRNLSVAFNEGRRAGLVLGALAVSLAAFVNLLSVEKSILGAVLAIIAIRGVEDGTTVRLGRLALCIAAMHLSIAAIVFTLFRDKLVHLIHLLQTLG
jgi:hypothetical protein